jgi:zinc transport system ATP-binding protein
VRSGCLGRCGLRPFYNSGEKRTAEENMAKLGIAGLASRCYRELSGGQQQRVLLARALCAAGRILLLDEPVAGLDPLAASDLYAVIKSLNGNGVSIIMISHDIAAAVKYASHILHIGHGGPLFYGSVADYLLSEAGRVYAGFEGELI